MEQSIVFITLGVTLILFIWGKLRYDIVAILALGFLAVWGIVPAEQAFIGFGHPAVITVAAILVVSRALQNSGLVDLLARWVDNVGGGRTLQIGLLCLLVTVASAFMNNIGALAIFMPVAVHLARQNGYSPSYALMPLAFASLLGGMTTLIGTPPNIIIATFRTDVYEAPFNMFDFSPVGLLTALAGLAFIVLTGKWLLPKRQAPSSTKHMFEIDNYITEVVIGEDSKIIGKTILEMREMIQAEVMVVGIVRNNRRIHAPSPQRQLSAGDILILEADTGDLKRFIEESKTELTGSQKLRKEAEGSGDIQTVEAIVQGNSPLIGENAISMNIRSRYDINLLALARRGRQIIQRIGHVDFKAGDVLLLQGRRANLQEAIISLHCLPLAQRDISIGKPRRTVLSLLIFAAAILAVVAGLLPVELAFTLAAAVMVIMRMIPLQELYASIDWPVIVLLAAMIPVGTAFETSGGTDLVAHQVLALGQQYPLWAVLGIVMLSTMLLSAVINNAATAVLMAPISIHIAHELNVSADSFLMAVAIGASCAFLTPIGHQSNTLVMGPGGYKFGDYWHLGLPLTFIVCAVSIPLILFFWPP
jgi:di/tricarboxylate transporter